MERVPINKIIECSTVDGPGLRSSVFVQRCNIHCLYCHNPETQNLCVSCGECVLRCPQKALLFKDGKVVWNKERCVNCDTCISICPNHASPKIEYLTAQEVYDRIKPNKMFLRGITVSGGECSLYPVFLEELFSLAKKDGLNCLMDSNGMVDYAEFPKLMDVTDGVMLDIKSWNEDVYASLVGYSNSMVKKNLKYLDEVNKIEELRIVYVPSYVDAKDCLDGIASTLKKEHIKTVRIKLITFRQNGVKGILSSHPSPTKEEMDELERYARSLGFCNIERR